MHDAKVDTVEIDALVFLVVHFDRAVKKLGASRSQIRAAAGAGVVPATGRRRPRMKILRLRKILTDDPRSDNPAIDGHKAAIGLLRKKELRNTGHHNRIEQSGQYREDEREAKTRSDFIDHVFLPSC